MKTTGTDGKGRRTTGQAAPCRSAGRPARLRRPVLRPERQCRGFPSSGRRAPSSGRALRRFWPPRPPRLQVHGSTHGRRRAPHRRARSRGQTSAGTALTTARFSRRPVRPERVALRSLIAVPALARSQGAGAKAIDRGNLFVASGKERRVVAVPSCGEVVKGLQVRFPCAEETPQADHENSFLPFPDRAAVAVGGRPTAKPLSRQQLAGVKKRSPERNMTIWSGAVRFNTPNAFRESRLGRRPAPVAGYAPVTDNFIPAGGRDPCPSKQRGFARNIGNNSSTGLDLRISVIGWVGGKRHPRAASLRVGADA